MRTSRSTPDWGPLMGGFLGGALVFWTPSVILHAISPDPGLAEFLWLTLVLPMLVVLFLVAPRWPREVILSALLGIWMLGPWFMIISGTFSGGGFRNGMGVKEIAVLIVMFPMTTFCMSAYDGTLFALVISTVLLGVVGKIHRKLGPEARRATPHDP